MTEPDSPKLRQLYEKKTALDKKLEGATPELKTQELLAGLMHKLAAAEKDRLAKSADLRKLRAELDINVANVTSCAKALDARTIGGKAQPALLEPMKGKLRFALAQSESKVKELSKQVAEQEAACLAASKKIDALEREREVLREQSAALIKVQVSGVENEIKAERARVLKTKLLTTEQKTFIEDVCALRTEFTKEMTRLNDIIKPLAGSGKRVELDRKEESSATRDRPINLLKSDIETRNDWIILPKGDKKASVWLEMLRTIDKRLADPRGLESMTDTDWEYVEAKCVYLYSEDRVIKLSRASGQWDYEYYYEQCSLERAILIFDNIKGRNIGTLRT